MFAASFSRDCTKAINSCNLASRRMKNLRCVCAWCAFASFVRGCLLRRTRLHLVWWHVRFCTSARVCTCANKDTRRACPYACGACAYARIISHVRANNLATQEEAKKGARVEVRSKETEIMKLQDEMAALKVLFCMHKSTHVRYIRVGAVYAFFLPSSVSL